MGDVLVNTWAVLASGVAHMLLGMLWYGPFFGKQWMALTNMTSEKMAAAKKKGMTRTYAMSFLTALVMAYVLAHVIVYSGASTAYGGLQAGFWVWLGFIATSKLSHVLFEGRSKELYLVDVGFYLVYLLVAGVILTLWQ